MAEVQVTHAPYGHTLNGHQVFSPDDQWVVYDTRNDPTHIGRTCCIEKVDIGTGTIERIYKTPAQTEHGPGVGAVAWHPTEQKVIFIHGLLNSDAARPYDFTRRFGAIWSAEEPLSIVAAEARTITAPLVAGALRGGTHAHSWSGDGEWISFTYNDYLIEQLGKRGDKVRDLRTIGVMAPGAVQVSKHDAEDFSGRYFSVVAATVTDDPKPGSDEIERAFDECWVGMSGYRRSDGTWQKRAIAFQGHLRTTAGDLLTEVFVADVPDDITQPEGQPIEGTLTTRPAVPAGLKQRRVTFTEDRKHPGIQGPRYWLRTSPDGSTVYFLMKDDDGVVQVYSIPINGGDMRQVTQLPASVQSQFNISTDGSRLALIAENSVWVTDIASGKSRRLTPFREEADAPVNGALWNHRGDKIVYNRYVASESGRFLQIFKIDLPD